MKLRPAMFVWTEDGTMRPEQRFAEMCRRQFSVGEGYALGPVDEVPGRSRAHLMARIKDVWDSLPATEKRFPTSEHLRKWALVHVGHCTETDFVLETAKDARQTAIALRKADEYAVIVQRGCAVKLCIAKSIAAPAVKAKEFQAVKGKVLDLLAGLLSLSPREMAQHSEDAA